MTDFIRDYPFEFAETRGEGDGLTLEGYVAVFDSPTVIHERGGSFTETVARGAFKKTLAERTPVLMFDHGQHPLIGDMPLGLITRAVEDQHGVFIRARLHQNWLIEPVREAIASKAVHGMSFRFEAINDNWNAKRTTRELVEVRVPEAGPVVMPAYDTTSVGVRSREAFRLLHDPEVRRDLAYMAARDAEDLALDEGAVRTDTPDLEPPAPEKEPANATPDNSDRVERLRTLAKLKGII